MVIGATNLMIFVIEDAVEVFDADICVVIETCTCGFDLIVVIIVDDANNFLEDFLDVVLDVVDVRDFDFVDSIDAIVVIDEIDEDIFLVVNIDVVDFSFSTCLRKKNHLNIKNLVKTRLRLLTIPYNLNIISI